MQTIMNMVDVNEIILSERALREGLVVDWMCRNNYLKDQLSFQGSIRERTVIHQAKRFGVNSKRSKSVSEFALTFYDYTKGILHNDNGEGRDLLWAAAKLHACGKQINISAYHKHSWYLIKNGELLGYSQSEHLMVAAFARLLVAVVARLMLPCTFFSVSVSRRHASKVIEGGLRRLVRMYKL